MALRGLGTFNAILWRWADGSGMAKSPGPEWGKAADLLVPTFPSQPELPALSQPRGTYPVGQSSSFTTQWVTHFPLYVREQMHPHTSVYTLVTLQNEPPESKAPPTWYVTFFLEIYFSSLQIKEQQKPKHKTPPQSIWWTNELSGGFYLQYKGLLTETGITWSQIYNQKVSFPQKLLTVYVSLGMAWGVVPSFHKGLLLNSLLWVSYVRGHSCSDSRWKWS